VHEAVRAGGLDPTTCALDDSEWKPPSAHFELSHESSHSELVVYSLSDSDERRIYCSISSWLADEDELETDKRGFWPDVLDAIETWAGAVQEYEDTPDLWATSADAAALIDGSMLLPENTPFSPEEQTVISAQIREIRNMLADQGTLSEEHLTRIGERLEESEEASKRLGRKDWLLLFAGGIFSLILADVLPPDAGQHILMMLAQGIGHFFLGGGPAALTT
jgi:hypothetical protein